MLGRVEGAGVVDVLAADLLRVLDGPPRRGLPRHRHDLAQQLAVDEVGDAHREDADARDRRDEVEHVGDPPAAAEAKAEGDKVVFGPVDPSVLVKIKVGDEVFVDNSNFLASQYYHRHQVSDKEYKVWDQFRDAEGKPLYPQRPMLLGPLFTQSASGVLPKGKFKGKMILLESLWDREAFAWQADWYRNKVKENLL